ncbi:MAG: hypothetical protein LH606_02285 [Cytophagaceae bacterium]|nr:hypothetical protein [Cytophagaceae bacterium]
MQENEFDDLFSKQLNRLPPPDFSERDWREVENQLVIKKLQKRLALFGWALPLLGVASMAVSGGLYYQLRQTHHELERLKLAAATAKVKAPAPVDKLRRPVAEDTLYQRIATRLATAVPERQRAAPESPPGILPLPTAPDPVFSHSIPTKPNPSDTTSTPEVFDSVLPELRALAPQKPVAAPVAMPLPTIQRPIDGLASVPKTDAGLTRNAPSPLIPAVNSVAGPVDKKTNGVEVSQPDFVEKKDLSPTDKTGQRTVSNRRKARRKTGGIDLPKNTPETTLADRTGPSGSVSEIGKKMAEPQRVAPSALPPRDSTRTETSAAIRQEPPKVVASRDTSSQVAKVTQSEVTGESTQGTIRRAGQAAPFSFNNILKFTSVGLQIGLPANVGYGLASRRGSVVGLLAGVRVARHWQVFLDVSSQSISPEKDVKRPVPSIPVARPKDPDFDLERFRVNNLKFTNLGTGINFVVTDRFALQPYAGVGWNLQLPRRYDVEYEFRHRPHRPPVFLPKPEERIVYARDRFESKVIHQVRLQAGFQLPIRDFLLINLEGFWNTQGRKTPTLSDTSGLRLGLSYRF